MVHSAWVGDMRAARMAGHSPATVPIRMAAPKPPALGSAKRATQTDFGSSFEDRNDHDVGDAEASDDVPGLPLDVATGYARWATVYDDQGNVLIAREQPTMHSLLDGLEGEPVPDVGCGTGRHLAWLSTRNRRIIGVDQSAE